ncbi:MAG: ester cyclase [Mucilaginibacter sp.]|nr:ester cyclase [Mucilaginibacter sp.]
MSKETNIAAQQKFGEAVNTGNYELFNELVAENSIDHDPAPGQIPGPEGYAQFFRKLRVAFPDMKLTVEQLSADDDTVSFAYRLIGTHQGDFTGIAGSGNTVNVRGMQISKFQDGKMTERWGSSDELGILKQIGATIS